MLLKLLFGCSVLLALSACVTSSSESHDERDISLEPQVPAEQIDPMMENNERLIRESLEDEMQRRIK